MPDIAKDASKAAKRAARKKGRVHLFVLMDESGSMSGLEEAVVTGCNEFIHAFRDNKFTRVWLAFFDGHPGEERMRLKFKSKKVADVRDLNPGDYNPRGITPLNDAVMASLAALDEVVKPEEGVFMAIITDGAENASETGAGTVARAIATFEKRGWSFVYLGANQNAEVSATDIGLCKKGQAFNFNATYSGITATSSLATQMASAYTVWCVSEGSPVAAAAAMIPFSDELYDKTGGNVEDTKEDTNGD